MNEIITRTTHSFDISFCFVLSFACLQTIKQTNSQNHHRPWFMRLSNDCVCVCAFNCWLQKWKCSQMTWWSNRTRKHQNRSQWDGHRPCLYACYLRMKVRVRKIAKVHTLLQQPEKKQCQFQLQICLNEQFSGKIVQPKHLNSVYLKRKKSLPNNGHQPKEQPTTEK